MFYPILTASRHNQYTALWKACYLFSVSLVSPCGPQSETHEEEEDDDVATVFPLLSDDAVALASMLFSAADLFK